MAHIRSGSIVSDIRGKVGTEIYSRNRGGAYVKAYAAPVQPNTAAQTFCRDQMAATVLAWQNLTEVERQKWCNVALSMKGKGGYFPNNWSGYTLFVKRKLTLLQYGMSQNPTPVDMVESTNPRMTFTSTTTTNITVQTNPNPLPPNGLFMTFFASKPVNSSIMSINTTTLRLVQFGGLSAPFGFNVTSNYESRVASLTGHAGSKIFWRFGLVLLYWDPPNGAARIYPGILSDIQEVRSIILS